MIDVDMPTHPRLIGRPMLDRWLWLCLILLAKKRFSDGVIRDLGCVELSGMFNLGSPRKVAEALLWFANGPDPLIENVEGGFRIVKFVNRQARKDNPEAVRKRMQEYRKRGPVTPVTAPVTDPFVTAIEKEIEKEEAKDLVLGAVAPSPDSLPSLTSLAEGWPAALLERVRLAVTSTRKAGTMAEGPWRAFLMAAKQFAPDIRIRAAEAYLDAAHASEGKGERYLLGIMRGENRAISMPRRSPEKQLLSFADKDRLAEEKVKAEADARAARELKRTQERLAEQERTAEMSRAQRDGVRSMVDDLARQLGVK